MACDGQIEGDRVGSTTVVYLVLWALILGLVGVAIGRAKGRPEAGFLWGAVLGPLGWLIVAVGPNFRPKCPECKGLVEPDAKKCMHCGSVLQQSEVQPSGESRSGSAVAGEDERPFAKCSGCGILLTERQSNYYKSQIWCIDCFRKKVG